MCSNLFGFPKFYLYIGQDYSIMMYAAEVGERGNTRNEEDFYDRAAFYKHSVFVCLWQPEKCRKY